jgi:hypothetical protein
MDVPELSYWKFVPETVTEEMEAAGLEASRSPCHTMADKVAAIYLAMVAAAPSPRDAPSRCFACHEDEVAVKYCGESK